MVSFARRTCADGRVLVNIRTRRRVADERPAQILAGRSRTRQRPTVSPRNPRAWAGRSFAVSWTRGAVVEEGDRGDQPTTSDIRFQHWLRAALLKYPETASRIFGHTTGQEKSDLQQGIPSLKVGLAAGLWNRSLAAGDAESAAYATVFRTEAHAFGWKDGKVQGVGEHDDTIVSWWLADRAARLFEAFMMARPTNEIITMEDLGIQRVKIGDDI